MKKLNLNKQSFIESYKGRRLVWMSNDENFAKTARDFPIFSELDPYRYKRVVIGKQIKFDDLLDLSDEKLDFLEISKYFKMFYLYKFRELEVVDLSSSKDSQQVLEISQSTLINKDDVIMIAPRFKYKDFILRVDLIIKVKGQVRIYDLSNSICPTTVNAISMAYNYMILKKLGYPVNEYVWRITSLDKDYISSSANVVENILDLFTEWKEYFPTKAIPIYKSTTALDGINLPSTKTKDLYEFLSQFENSLNFDQTLTHIKETQLEDNLPKERILNSYQEYEDCRYMPFFFELEKIKTNSVFDFVGDIAFTFSKKLELFYNGKTLMSEANDEDLISNKLLSSENINDLKDPNKRNLFIYNNNLKRLIQRDSFVSKKPFVVTDELQQYLNKVNKPTYFIDIKTVKFAIPKFPSSSPFEHIPYEFSIHVLDEEEKTTHYQWIATNKTTMYTDFWLEFAKVIGKHGEGTIVTYNSYFDEYLIKMMINKPNAIIPEHIKKIIHSYKKNIIDLMKVFSRRYFYDYTFGSKYNLKTVTTYFDKKIDYSKLTRIRTTIDAAFRSRLWLMSDKQNSMWKDINKDILQFCKMESYSMLIIYKELMKKYEIKSSILGNA